MHEEADREKSLNSRHQQHGEQVSLQEEYLDASQRQYQHVHNQIALHASLIRVHRSLLLSFHVHQVHHGNHEHPDQVDEVPVQRPDLEVVGVITTTLVAENYDQKGNRTANDVREVQAGYSEEGRSEHWRSPGILKEPHTFADEPHPLFQVQGGEGEAEDDRDEGPHYGFGLVSGLGSTHANQNRQTARDQYESHE